jgi:hypothetical protein
MESDLKIDVAALDGSHRRALEEVIGCELSSLAIRVIDVTLPEASATRPAQTLDVWTKVYDGLSDCEIDEIDQIAKTRANLTRHLPKKWMNPFSILQ